ncbi:hypothetical protein EDB80DRAFT_143020 [Ilyonectria destructans]|nr:hypothetical protein EDB80DRAFT_143020 [Ilyonectria destructans]
MYTSRTTTRTATSEKSHRYLLPAGTCQGEPLHLHLWRWRRWGRLIGRHQSTRPLGKTLSRLAQLGRMAALDSISPSITSFGWPGSPRGEWLRPHPESNLQLRMAATYTLPARVCGAHPHTICRPAQQSWPLGRVSANLSLYIPLYLGSFQGSDARCTSWHSPVSSSFLTVPVPGRWLDWMRTPWQRSTSIQIVEDPHPIRLCHNPIFPSARCIYPRTGGSPVSPVLRRRGSQCKHVPVRFPSRLNLRQPADWGSPEVER